MTETQDTKRVITKFRSGNYWIPVSIEFIGDRGFLTFPYDEGLLKEVKKLEGRKWHGFDETNPRKCWSIPLTQRNVFCIQFLQAKDGIGPYKHWYQDINVDDHKFHFPLYKHQKQLALAAIKKHSVLWAAEMGVGKTLAAFEVIKYCLENNICAEEDIWWLGTNSSLRSTELEMRKWKFKPNIQFFTYDKIRSMAKEGFNRLPGILICDEISKCKSHNAERSKAVKFISDRMRARDNEANDIPFIIGLTGTPAPKSPVDWWHLIEIICPGWLVESNASALQHRLALVDQSISLQGAVFPKIVSWLTSEDICMHKFQIDTGTTDDDGKPIYEVKHCAKPSKDSVHDLMLMEKDSHRFVKSINEVAKLHRRLKGVVEICLKKDCLDLPDIREDIIRLQPSESVLRMARFIVNTASRAVTARSKLRELSDGFQYEEVPSGQKEKCPECRGTRQLLVPKLKDDGTPDSETAPSVQECTICDANGEIDILVRTAQRIPTPKIDQLILDLEEHEDVGRLVTYAGFTDSIDRIVETSIEQGWGVIKVDGRGWKAFSNKGDIMHMSQTDMLAVFQKMQGDVERINYVGHPGSGGMGVTLTASPTICYYSLTDNGEDYRQSGDRIHRPGMDINRGATHKHYHHLPVDKLVLKNLKTKGHLESMSLGQIKDAFKEEGYEL